MNTSLAVLAMVLYVLSAVLNIRHMLSAAQSARIAVTLASTACVIHAVFLFNTFNHASGSDMSMTNVLCLISVIITIALIASKGIIPNTPLLPGVYLFTALAVGSAAFIPDEYILTIPFTPALVSHITLSLLAYGCLFIAFLYAMQMTLIKHKLKDKGAELLNITMPPLMLVESVLFGLTLIGTLLLGISLLTGWLFVDMMVSTKYAHKTVLSTAAMSVYLLLLFGQYFWGWKNKQVVWLTSFGLGLLTLGYFGSRFVIEIVL